MLRGKIWVLRFSLSCAIGLKSSICPAGRCSSMNVIKFSLVSILFLFSISSFATDFDCKSEETGIGYRVNSKAKSIVVYESISKKTIVIHEFEKMTVRHEGSREFYSYANAYGIFMEVKIQGKKITGSFDDDEALVCEKMR